MDKPIKKKPSKASAFDKDTERKLQAELELQGKSPVPFLKELGYAHPPSVATNNKQHPDSIEYRDERLKEIRYTTDAEINKLLSRLNKSLDACEREMIDPNNPDQYTMLADASEVEVIWKDYSGEKPERKTELLSSLLAKVQTLAGCDEIVGTKIRATDPRKMFIETVKAVMPVIRALGDRTGDWKAPETHPEDVKRKLETQAKALFTEYLNRYVDKDEAMSRFKEDAPTLSPYVM